MIRYVRSDASTGSDQMATVSVSEAARILGVGEPTIRRWIKRGKLPAARIERPQGFEWRVAVDQVNPTSTDQMHDQLPDPPDHLIGQAHIPPPDHIDLLTLAHTLAAQLTAEREKTAVERDRVIALEQERAELYGRLGFYQAQLEQAKERIALLEAPQHTPKRPWWRFWE